MNNSNILIWDWNGTLLNDIGACILCMNEMLRKRNMIELDSSRYKEIFAFPVIKYYEKLGFDFRLEPFEKLAIEYISLYQEKSMDSALYHDVIEVLDKLKSNKQSQIILSAMEQRALETQVRDNKVCHYFEEIIGLDNIYAKSKIDNAKQFLDRKSISPDLCIVIGDTYHDYEVAKELGSKCILINRGHQNLQKLEFDNNIIVLDDITDLLDQIQ